MRQVMNELRELGLLKPMNGAEVVDLEDRKLGSISYSLLRFFNHIF